MKKTLTFLLILFCINAFGQNERIISYDLIDGIVDTLNLADFDTSIIREHTNYYLGNFNQEFNILNEEVPIENIYPESNFTLKKQASLDYDINNFPIRTSVKLFKLENDSLKSKCSGSIISRKHVLTACHCVADFFGDSLLYDSLFVSPVFDNGESSQLFKGSWVKKVYIFENWNYKDDFSVLELEKPIGELTGWISIGFDSDDISLLDGIFYKFSYPAISIPQIDTNSYNGDTLYYGYGLVDVAHNENIMINNTSGIPGESGSSLIKIKNEISYTSYGVLNFSTNLNHCRLLNWEYFALKDIIKNDLSFNLPDSISDYNITIYPNPTADWIYIYLPNELKNGTIKLLNLQGDIIKIQQNDTQEIKLDLSDLRNGVYFLMIDSEKKRIINKVIKNGGL